MYLCIYTYIVYTHANASEWYVRRGDRPYEFLRLPSYTCVYMHTHTHKQTYT